MLDVNGWAMGEVYKNEFDIVMFRFNEVNFEATFDDHQNT